MAPAIEVARYLIHLSGTEEEPDFLTHLRLQKLLYYVQAWSLVMRLRPMFAERIEAWAHGPVIPAVYRQFAGQGNSMISPEIIGDCEIALDDDDREFVSSVWASYKGYSATKLREMTHQEDPWINARQGVGPAERCDQEITCESILSFFSTVPTE